jgi:hypothetical protein
MRRAVKSSREKTSRANQPSAGLVFQIESRSRSFSHGGFEDSSLPVIDSPYLGWTQSKEFTMSKRKPIECEPYYYEDFIKRARKTVESFPSGFNEYLLMLDVDDIKA